MTPKGVEHFYYLQLHSHFQNVKIPMTPKGVEHWLMGKALKRMDE